MDIIQYVLDHSARGKCRCGRCIQLDTPGLDPTGHTVDLVFFPVAAVGEPTADEFRRLTAEHVGDFVQVNPLDGEEHSYIELGGWIGDQGLAMQYMGLGTILGVFTLLTPYTVLGLAESSPLAMQAAGAGYVSVQAKKGGE